MSSIVSDKIKNGVAIKSLNQQTSQSSMIKFMPNKSEKSEILNDLQISNLVENFPSMMKTMDWTLVYSVNRDGVSVGTFFEKCRDWRYTLLVIKDTQGFIFGGFCCEVWKQSSKFYGTGESFIYTFKNGNNVTVFDWTGENDQIQWANQESIGLGGGTLGRFAIYLKDNFLKGSSSAT